MLQNYNKWKVLQEFFTNPTSELQLREISRNIKLGLPSVKNYLKKFEKESFIVIKKNRVQGYPLYLANRDNPQFLFYKKVNLIDQITNSGLLQELYDLFLPNVIVLFGSASKGEDVEGSDIDIFVGAKEKTINLSKYEKTFKRKVNLFFAPDFHKLSPELKNNLLNGIILKGYIKVF
ncbi:nucleotidyltransferase domain-containing protein [Candidatus Woesearchaeota archaeon]|nr:nucleotidyltransferase domain-containing protein [Candidatus Woesearchaeota archaeon]